MNKIFSRDLGIKIFNELNDQDLASVFQADKYTYSLYNDENLWMNRVLKNYGKYLGTAKEIKRKYMNDFTWKQYYIWLQDTLNNRSYNLFFYSSRKGQDDILKILMHIYPMHGLNFECMIVGIKNGHLNILKTFVEHGIDPSSKDNTAFIKACLHGHMDIVKFLLKDPRVDPSVNNNFALTAKYNGHNDIVELLMKDPRVIRKL